MNIDPSVWGCEPLTRGVSTRTDGKYANVMFFFDTESLAIVRKNDQFWPYCLTLPTKTTDSLNQERAQVWYETFYRFVQTQKCLVSEPLADFNTFRSAWEQWYQSKFPKEFGSKTAVFYVGKHSNLGSLLY